MGHRFGHDFSKIAIFAGGPSVGQAALGGLLPDASPEREDLMLGGIGETLGDITRPIGTALGNVVGSIAGALTGITISSNTNVGPLWGDNGHFHWEVGFNTSGQDGWIVQEIVNTYRAENAAGQAQSGGQPTPHYWEAWPVDSSSTVSPARGATNDFWIRPNRGANTKGHWSMTGKAYFTKTNPGNAGLSAAGVPDAGILLSATTAPPDLGIARLHRYAQGTWDSTGTTPTHTGSAGP